MSFFSLVTILSYILFCLNWYYYPNPLFWLLFARSISRVLMIKTIISYLVYKEGPPSVAPRAPPGSCHALLPLKTKTRKNLTRHVSTLTPDLLAVSHGHYICHPVFKLKLGHSVYSNLFNTMSCQWYP